jgi:chitosanase
MPARVVTWIAVGVFASIGTVAGPRVAARKAVLPKLHKYWLSTTQLRRANELISVFENSTTTIQYGYAQNLDDGRGVTVGRAGFTTGTCDALAVIDLYTKSVPENQFSPFHDELKRLCEEQSDDTTGLPQEAFVAAWQSEAQQAGFRRAQDSIVKTMYYEPAMRKADTLGLRTALARVEIYDAILQHGDGDDPDGLSALIAATTELVGPPTPARESVWLRSFLDVRLNNLRSPSNASTARAWSESTDRVECIRSLAQQGNTTVRGPLSCTVYESDFTIK